MKYCKKCILPDTRPELTIGDDGICSGCKGNEFKRNINWTKRKKALDEIVDMAKKRSSGYDCLVPVSGGKDSMWQVIKCLEYGLHVLTVTWKTPARTKIGQENLDNLMKLRVDHIDYTIDQEVEKKFMYKTLLKTGSTGVPMHMGLYGIPLKIASAFNIPLVIWGESSHMEYGGTEDDWKNSQLNHAWFKRHGILQNTLIHDWVDDELTEKELTAYVMPTEEEFAEKKLCSIFLGYYLPWDPIESLRVAKEHGFKVREEGPKIGYYNYADIDCDFISIHHYFKWLKFGFTRLFDNLSIEIRNGRMTREEALKILEQKGPQIPHDDIDKLCSFLRISKDHFHEIEEKFRNKNVWSKKDGKWIIKDFILPNWRWWDEN